jgi:hypothetical protein
VTGRIMTMVTMIGRGYENSGGRDFGGIAADNGLLLDLVTCTLTMDLEGDQNCI